MIKKFRVKDLRTNTYLSSYAERGLLFHYEKRWVDVGWFIQCEQLESPQRFKVEQFTCSYDNINPKYKLPVNQRLYLSRKGKITWRNTGLYIGLTTSKQGSDGFVKVEINIGRE
jgi:hypothetical protein